MTISGQSAHKRLLHWDIWWRWALASLVGITVATMLYWALPDSLVNPLDDEDIWLIQPWRVAVLTCVFYTPISLAQWLVLRRYVPRAWWWLVVTWGRGRALPRQHLGGLHPRPIGMPPGVYSSLVWAAARSISQPNGSRCCAGHATPIGGFGVSPPRLAGSVC
jgi:hypothetical protein